jgi:hypothetical protein
MGAHLDVGLQAPFTSGRERDFVHARCIGSVARRLRRLGWLVRTEVIITTGRSHGFIDILAFHPPSGVLLVVEVKTQLDDIGRIERIMSWYEREAWSAAKAVGWHGREVHSCLILLATAENDGVVRRNRETFVSMFPGRAPAFLEWIAAPGGGRAARRFVVMLDPHSHRREWAIRLAVDGRRSPAPYIDYADCARRLRLSDRRSSSTAA